MSEAGAGVPPGIGEALGWIGFDLDDVGGAQIGAVVGVYVDAVNGAPAWLVVSIGRRRRAKAVVVSVRECAAGAGRVWTAQDRAALRAAPAVDPHRPLLREHEAAICAHYGIGVEVGRHAEVAGRDEGAVTAEPA